MIGVNSCQSVKKMKQGDNEIVTCLELVGEKYLASGYWQNVIKIWDLETHSCVANLREHKGPVLFHSLVIT